MGVPRMGACREAHVLVRARERNIEPRQESMDVYKSHQYSHSQKGKKKR